MSIPRFLVPLAAVAGLALVVAMLASSRSSDAHPGHDTMTAPATAPVTAQVVDGTRIPFLFRNNHILLRAVVDDSDSLWFILDSGAGGNVVNASTAKRLGLTVTAGAQAHGAGGRVDAGILRGSRIRLPGLADMGDSMMTTIDLDMLALRTGHPCDGIIGLPFWQSAVVEIDYARSELVLHDPRTWRAPEGLAALPLTFEQGHPYVEARATLPGGKELDGRFILDTGSVMALILDPPGDAADAALKQVPRTLTMVLGGVGGRRQSPAARIDKLEIGPFAVEKPVAVFRSEGPGGTNAPGTMGNIGADVLRRFKVTFDYTGKHLYLAKAAAFGEPFEADMSGLVLSAKDDGSGIVVLLVQEDSPAKDAGVKEGDVLVSVDGKPVANAALVDLRADLRREGRTVKLALQRGNEVTERTLVTRRLL